MRNVSESAKPPIRHAARSHRDAIVARLRMAGIGRAADFRRRTSLRDNLIPLQNDFLCHNRYEVDFAAASVTRARESALFPIYEGAWRRVNIAVRSDLDRQHRAAKARPLFDRTEGRTAGSQDGRTTRGLAGRIGLGHDGFQMGSGSCRGQRLYRNACEKRCFYCAPSRYSRRSRAGRSTTLSSTGTPDGT